jgi:hypothetical protein
MDSEYGADSNGLFDCSSVKVNVAPITALLLSDDGMLVDYKVTLNIRPTRRARSRRGALYMAVLHSRLDGLYGLNVDVGDGEPAPDII